MQTAIGNAVLLYGSTANGAITLSTGSTYTTGNGQTETKGSIINQGTFVFNGGGGVTSLLLLQGDTTLTGGGTIQLNNAPGNGQPFIEQASGGLTLTNTDNTIQGSGTIGNGGLTVLNGAAGTIFANAPGQTLLINGSGGLTNNGTLKVAAGSTMVVASNLTNFSGGTLTGGTYIVKGTAGNPGTLQITSLPGDNGGQITSNAATIVLDGPTAQITDSANKDALSQFQDNLAGGNFTVSGGQAFSTNPGGNDSDFTNAGNLYVADAASSFTTSGNYTQTGGATQVDGTLTASGGSVNINGGVLEGLGTVTGNVFIGAGGTLSPGDPANAVALTDPPGPINITGNLQVAGTFNEIIGGAPNTGTFGQAVVGGSGTLDFGSTLDVSLINGFVPVGSEAFLIINASSAVSGQFTNVDFLNNTLGDTFSVDYSHAAQGEVFLDVNAPGGSGGPGGTGNATPEPAEFLPLAGVLGGLALWKIRRNRKTAA
jgi:hypothetical protein